MITIKGITEAYLDCRKKKRNTINATKFEVDFECNLVRLMNEVNSRTYFPSRSIAFVVTRPRYREIFAADFRDRVIHHYIGLRIVPILEKVMNDRSFSCRKDKGTLSGINQLKEDMKDCSCGYTKDCYVAKCDIQGFFMSISRSMAAKKIDELIIKNYDGDDKEDLRWLAYITITNAPEKNCIMQSSKIMWKYIPPHKSLFTNGSDMGLPIGNLPSQLIANYIVDVIDWAVEKENIEIIYHGRYVDDMYLISTDKESIFKAMRSIRFELKVLNLTLHPFKFYMQHYSKGIQFTGTIIKPGRSYTIKRTVHSFEDSIKALERASTIDTIYHAACKVNSYLGSMIHNDTYAIRRRILTNSTIYDKVYVGGKFEKVVIKKKYRYKEYVKKQISKGKFSEIGLANNLFREDS